MPDDDRLEAQAAAGVHPHDDGRPLPVQRPHAVLLAAFESNRVLLAALVRWLEREGLLSRAALDDIRREVVAGEMVDSQIGLIADLLNEGAIAPWPAWSLARAEARFPCGCTHEVPEERSR